MTSDHDGTEEIVVVHDACVVARIGLRRRDDKWPDRVQAGYLDSLYVRSIPVLDRVFVEAASRGIRRLRVQCASRDTSLREFYESAGFRFRGIVNGAALLERILNADESQRAPFSGEAYHSTGPLPVSVLLDSIRSQYNVGSFFRTGDAAGISKLYLCGITAHPPAKTIAKTALGAEDRLPWNYFVDPVDGLDAAVASGARAVAVETSTGAADLYEWDPEFPLCIVFGNEVDGISPELLERIGTRVRIPMLGVKHSLNVATAGGVVIYELLRKHRRLIENSR